MKVLLLSRYGRLGASSRMRTLQYIPCLEREGLNITVLPLFADTYVADLQRNRRNFLEVFHAYAKRLYALLCGRSYSLVWIEKEALPWLPAWFERMLLAKNIPYVLDYDDAVFHYYDQHHNWLIRQILRSKHRALIRGSELVVAGNEYLADYARGAGAKRVEIVPTVVDLDRYPPLLHADRDALAPPRVGWIGQRATAGFLCPYKSLFSKLTAEGLAVFVAIGIEAKDFALPMDSIAWKEESEVESLTNLDIGIMPLLDEPFARGKCGYKLVQYMACGLPVVASPVGANCRIVEDGVNGFLADTPEAWEKTLRALLVDRNLRINMGHAGREKVEQRYCIQVTGPKMADLLRATGGNVL